MRVQPRAVISVGLLVAYIALVSILWTVNDIDYDAVADTRENIVEGIIAPVAIGAAFLAVAASYLGWWRPAMVEEKRVGPRWGWVLPVLLFAFVFSNVASIDYSSDAVMKLLPVLAIGTILVGFSEELLTRGLMLVGFRGSFSEAWSWFFCSLCFALLHGINALFGQSIGSTIVQMGAAFLIGTAFYVTRRITGMLVVTMVIHALWDFGALGIGDKTPPAIAGFLQYAAAIVAIVLLVKILREGKDVEVPQPASR
jgi:membrane protease YdiL (CAAX protease family)